jgi:hypothetical protein
MKVTPMELELWEQLQWVRQRPETIDVAQLLEVVEVAAAQLPEAQRLQFAGDALLQLAELCAVRAGVLMTQWEEAYRDPIVELGFFADIVRQTMAVHLSDLLEPAPIRKRRTKSTRQPEGSLVALVDKAAVLAMVDQLEAVNEEAQKQAVLAIAHLEDGTCWTEAISQWLQAAPDRSVSISDLGYDLKMPWVEIWLGVLFGDFQLEQWGEFYESLVWVKYPND